MLPLQYCGTGTFALVLAGSAARVVGFEAVPSAVVDARRNAEACGMGHVEFVCGDLETNGEELLQACPDPDVVVVSVGRCSGGVKIASGCLPSHQLTTCFVHGWRCAFPALLQADPARAGLSKAVREYLKVCGARRIIYVSCNPSTQARDILDLCGHGLEHQRARMEDEDAASGAESAPYVLARVTPVDMFPQTYHVETVAVLEKV